MFNYSEAYYHLLNKLKALYDVREAQAIAHEVMNDITGLDKLQRLMDKDKQLTPEQAQTYESRLAGLLKGAPMQYVLGYAWFMGKRYKVNEHVLIPRPETEELVQWISAEFNPEVSGQESKIKILDVGTGSGCIPISLKLAIPQAVVTSCDISASALIVAKENAEAMNATIALIEMDFLDATQWVHLSKYDVVVSNPPYIPVADKETLDKHVKDFEPATALFVDDDALLFYRAIAAFGKAHLNKDGAIYCELHQDHAVATQAMFQQQGYTAELRKNIHDNWRMLKAILL